MSHPQWITVLGATGSIGLSTLDVIGRHPDRYRVFALSGYSRLAELQALCLRHLPRFVVVPNAEQARALQDRLNSAGLETRVLVGEAGLCEISAHPEVDAVMAAIVGAAGLKPTLAAVEAGKRVLLANKEALVMSGALFMNAVRASGAVLLPIDSEHNAIFQCLRSRQAQAEVKRIVLTASGGPFRGRSRADLAQVTREQAVAHPKWSMGPKISVDSATLMNKGLELIEAHHLFGVGRERLDVLVHPQSLVHSLVEFVDGSTLAQLGLPDMRTSLAVGLGWPARIDSGVGGLDLLKHPRLEFEAPDTEAFPCLRLAWDAMAAGGTAPAVLNAANEVAVSAFLQGRIGFLSIPALVEDALAALPAAPADSLEVLLAADAQARQLTERNLAGHLSP